MLPNTLTACWWMTSLFIVAYTILMFPTYLQRDLHLSPGLVALPIMLQNVAVFSSSLLWGFVADRFGRLWALIIPAIVGFAITPLYLLTSNYTLIVIFFALQGAFAGGGIWLASPSYLSERFPTEVRATAAGFCYHQGGIWGGFVAPVLAYVAATLNVGFPIPMLVATSAGLLSVIVALLFSPETRGKELSPDLVLA
jgi:SHS family lactate transporter-like MFS transporter